MDCNRLQNSAGERTAFLVASGLWFPPLGDLRYDACLPRTVAHKNDAADWILSENKYVNVTQLRVVARPDLSLGVAPDAPTPMSRSCTASLVVVCLAEARVDILLLVSSSWRY